MAQGFKNRHIEMQEFLSQTWSQENLQYTTSQNFNLSQYPVETHHLLHSLGTTDPAGSILSPWRHGHCSGYTQRPSLRTIPWGQKHPSKQVVSLHPATLEPEPHFNWQLPHSLWIRLFGQAGAAKKRNLHTVWKCACIKRMSKCLHCWFGDFLIFYNWYFYIICDN